jgi:hypothetical protein
VKQAADARAAGLARYRRALTIATDLRWQAHREQHFLRRRVLGWISSVIPLPAVRTRRRARKFALGGKLVSRP